MQQTGRRVHQLKLKGSDPDAVSSSIVSLEDAFNTASFPGLPPHGLLLIRNFDIGRFVSNATPMAISQLIDKRIRVMARHATCVDDEEHPDAPMVWFSDSSQAVLAYIDLLAQDKVPSAWYWKTALPMIQPHYTLQQTVRVLFNEHVLTPARPIVSARLVEQLMAHNRQHRILQLFSQQLATDMLHASNIYPANLTESRQDRGFDPAQQIPTHWKPLIVQSADLFGSDDARTVWLTLNALTAVNPAIVESVNLNQQMAIAIHRITENHQLPGRGKKAAQDDGTGLSHQTSQDNVTGQRHANDNGRDIADDSLRFTKSNRADDSAHSTGNNPADPEHAARHSGQMHSNRLGSNDNGEHRLPDAARKQPIDNATDVIATLPAGRNQHRDTPVAEDIVKSGKNAWNFNVQEHRFLFTRFAGLAFAIPLLDIMGIRQLLQQYAWCAEYNVPGRLLRKLAHRQKMSRQDPALHWLPETPFIRDLPINAFAAPRSWEKLLLTPLKKLRVLYRHPMKAYPGRYYLTDQSRKLLLYCGFNDEDEILPDWISSADIREMPGLYATPCLSDLENTLLLLCHRYARRYASMGLKTLFNTEGYVALTRTHLDIMLHPGSVNIGVRSAGLDFNPGWVSWLGRVVQFHYDYEGYLYE